MCGEKIYSSVGILNSFSVHIKSSAALTVDWIPLNRWKPLEEILHERKSHSVQNLRPHDVIHTQAGFSQGLNDVLMARRVSSNTACRRMVAPYDHRSTESRPRFCCWKFHVCERLKRSELEMETSNWRYDIVWADSGQQFTATCSVACHRLLPTATMPIFNRETSWISSRLHSRTLISCFRASFFCESFSSSPLCIQITEEVETWKYVD